MSFFWWLLASIPFFFILCKVTAVTVIGLVGAVVSAVIVWGCYDTLIWGGILHVRKPVILSSIMWLPYVNCLPGWGVISPLWTDSTAWFSWLFSGRPQLTNKKEETFRPNSKFHFHRNEPCGCTQLITFHRVMEVANMGWWSSGHSGCELRLCGASWALQRSGGTPTG